jgi:hypothetical protein
MIRDKRIASYIVIALIVGVALAFAVALSHSESSASTLSPQAAAAAAQTGVASDTAANDAAKQQPTLDQFTSKDPFVPLTVADNSSTSTTGTGGTTSDTNLTAVIKVNGSSQTVAVGNNVPSSNPVFTITAITTGDVTFKLVSGKFSDGSDSVTVTSGQAVKVVDSGSSKSYTLAVTSIGNGGSTGGSGSGSTSSHSITVASITSQNSTALVTLVVDGKTYSDVKIGATISTTWGQIKIIDISVTQQTVTIMHGDVTVTLKADQTVVK